ncbi:hypothetical protein BDQ12DRAFT_727368 [Crucibulum laeve]|uniref:Acetyl-CoA hydrolase/transferase C-terminal domain-containing protein n=1 Tax=Crucibulum laeve TaxID=68775 RepID=A0A5C3LMK7_9AGAR|nr:hypothetical protein BDQ12DRAFT_727368 [Crucibulum laeve]
MRNAFEFLSDEVTAGRLPKTLLSLQSAIDNAAKSSPADGQSDQGRCELRFRRVRFPHYTTRLVQLIDIGVDAFFRFFNPRKLVSATAISIRLSPEGFLKLYATRLQGRLLHRSQQVSNSPDIIYRLSVVVTNLPLEIDVVKDSGLAYPQTRQIVLVLGKFVSLTTAAPAGSFFRIINAVPRKPTPLVSTASSPLRHISNRLHDLDVIVTEQGLADVQGLSPCERAPIVIENYAYLDYKDILHGIRRPIISSYR